MQRFYGYLFISLLGFLPCTSSTLSDISLSNPSMARQQAVGAQIDFNVTADTGDGFFLEWYFGTELVAQFDTDTDEFSAIASTGYTDRLNGSMVTAAGSFRATLVFSDLSMTDTGVSVTASLDRITTPIVLNVTECDQTVGNSIATTSADVCGMDCTANFTCKGFYEESGAAVTHVCLPDATWDPPAPICTKVTTAAPPSTAPTNTTGLSEGASESGTTTDADATQKDQTTATDGRVTGASRSLEGGAVAGIIIGCILAVIIILVIVWWCCEAFRRCLKNKCSCCPSEPPCCGEYSGGKAS